MNPYFFGKKVTFLSFKGEESYLYNFKFLRMIQSETLKKKT